jgi:hypothetical protein
MHYVYVLRNQKDEWHISTNSLQRRVIEHLRARNGKYGIIKYIKYIIQNKHHVQWKERSNIITAFGERSRNESMLKGRCAQFYNSAPLE